MLDGILKHIFHKTSHTYGTYVCLLQMRPPYLDGLCAAKLQITVQLCMVSWTPTVDALRNFQYAQNPTAYFPAICAVPCAVSLLLAPKQEGFCFHIITVFPLHGSPFLSVSIILAYNIFPHQPSLHDYSVDTTLEVSTFKKSGIVVQNGVQHRKTIRNRKDRFQQRHIVKTEKEGNAKEAEVRESVGKQTARVV